MICKDHRGFHSNATKAVAPSARTSSKYKCLLSCTAPANSRRVDPDTERRQKRLLLPSFELMWERVPTRCLKVVACLLRIAFLLKIKEIELSLDGDGNSLLASAISGKSVTVFKAAMDYLDKDLAQHEVRQVSRNRRN